MSAREFVLLHVDTQFLIGVKFVVVVLSDSRTGAGNVA